MKRRDLYIFNRAKLIVNFSLHNPINSLQSNVPTSDVSLFKSNLLAIESHEHEADFIGMLLSASAGYDPRVAPVALQKMYSNHHLFHLVEKRMKYMAQPEVMQKEVNVYEARRKLRLITCFCLGLVGMTLSHSCKIEGLFDCEQKEELKVALKHKDEVFSSCKEQIVQVRLQTKSLIVFAKPIEFALLFTFGNLLAIGSTTFLIVPTQQIRMMFDPVCMSATTIYFGCVILALICALLVSTIGGSLCFMALLLSGGTYHLIF